eukprot:15473334-Alexandrium_andersonii.AAC.1
MAHHAQLLPSHWLAQLRLTGTSVFFRGDGAPSVHCRCAGSPGCLAAWLPGPRLVPGVAGRPER